MVVSQKTNAEQLSLFLEKLLRVYAKKCRRGGVKVYALSLRVSFSSMSTVMRSRSYSGFQSHS